MSTPQGVPDWAQVESMDVFGIVREVLGVVRSLAADQAALAEVHAALAARVRELEAGRAARAAGDGEGQDGAGAEAEAQRGAVGDPDRSAGAAGGVRLRRKGHPAA